MSTLKQWIRADCTLVQNWFWDYRVHSWSANEFIVRNQLMFTQRTAVIQQGPATTQLMFNHTQRSARQHLKQASSPLNCLSTSFQPPLGQWLLFWHTVKKYPSHFMIYQKKTVHAATFRHSIGSSSPQYSPSCLEARYFYLWRVHSIGHFHNSSRCCLKENQLHLLDAPVPIYFSCYTDSIPVHGLTTVYSLTQIKSSTDHHQTRCDWVFHS